MGSPYFDDTDNLPAAEFHGPGGPIDPHFQERRGLIIAGVFITIYGIFTGLHSIGFLLLEENTPLVPGIARLSVLINVALLAVFMLITALNFFFYSRNIPRRELQTASMHLCVLAVTATNIAHIHLAGSQHSLLPLAIPGIAVIVSWVLGRRASWIYFLLGSVGYLGVSLAELAGQLPYGPLLQTGPEMAKSFSTGRAVGFNFLTYMVVSTIVLLAVDFFEMDRRRRIGQLRQATRAARDAMTEVRRLRALIPMCSSCKKVRTDEGFWKDVSTYISDISEGRVSHGLCPDCTRTLYPELAPHEPPDYDPSI